MTYNKTVCIRALLTINTESRFFFMKVFIFSELPLKFVNSLLMFENYFDRLGLLFNIIKKLKLFTGIEVTIGVAVSYIALYSLK